MATTVHPDAPATPHGHPTYHEVTRDIAATLGNPSRGYFVLMAPRMFFALFLAGFAAELLPRETVSGWLGSESGFLGIMIASAAGIVVPAGGVVAYPLALAMYKIGVGIPQLVAFLTTWEVFALHRVIAWELPFLGGKFVALRLSSSFFLPPLAGFLAALLVTLFPA